MADEIVGNRFGATLRQIDVVIAVAGGIRMPFDRDTGLGVVAQGGDELIEIARGTRFQFRAIRLEQHIAAT